MMKRWTFGSILLLVSLSSFACDICGCGVGSYYLGILPEFQKRFAGIRYQYKGIRSHIGPGGTSTYLTTNETYQVAEIWGAINIGNRFRVVGFLPFNLLEKKNQETTSSRKGPGDIAAIGYYRLLNKRYTVGERLLVQSLWIGGGIKLPTGAYDSEEKNTFTGTQNSFQLGSGSVDFSLNAAYDIRFQDAGINVNTSYKINLPNRDDYHYGNKLGVNLLAYYKFRIADKFSIAPNAGIQYELADKDRITRNLEIFETGGYSLMGTAGAEFNFGRLGVGFNTQSGLSQHLGEGKTFARNRAMVYTSFSF